MHAITQTSWLILEELKQVITFHLLLIAWQIMHCTIYDFALHLIHLQKVLRKQFLHHGPTLETIPFTTRSCYLLFPNASIHVFICLHARLVCTRWSYIALTGVVEDNFLTKQCDCSFK